MDWQKHSQNHKFMRLALEQAQLALTMGEIPVGAVIVQRGLVVACGHNLRETRQSALAHAEVVAIESACQALGTWRLEDCCLYVTLEPCPMCAGAIVNARIPRVVFGAYDLAAGCMGSVADLHSLPYSHKPEVYGGILEQECEEMLTVFFQNMRQNRK